MRKFYVYYNPQVDILCLDVQQVAWIVDIFVPGQYFYIGEL